MSWKKTFIFEIEIKVGGEVRRLEVPTGDMFIIGRASECDLVFDYPFVSRQHARVSWNRSDWIIEDLGSRNGLVINGNRVQKWVIKKPAEVGQSQATHVKIDEMVLSFKMTKKEESDVDSDQDGEVCISPDIEAAIRGFNSEETRFGKTKYGTHKYQKPEDIEDENNVRYEELNLDVESKKIPVKEVKNSSAPEVRQGMPKPEAPKAATPMSTAKEVISVALPVDEVKKKQVVATPAKQPSSLPSLDQQVGGFNKLHPKVLSSTYRRVEASVIWRGVLYDVKEFDPSSKITLGSSQYASLQIPTLPRGWALANVHFADSVCWVPETKLFSITRDGVEYGSKVLAKNGQITQKAKGYSFKITPKDVVQVEIDPNVKVVLRYIPAEGKLSKKQPISLDHGFRQAFLGSLIVHGILAIALILAAPRESKGPKLKNVPERYARLLVEPPKPILPVPTPPTTTLPPIPEPPKVVDVPKVEPPKPKPQPPEPKKIAKPEKPRKPEPKKPESPVIVKNPPLPVKQPVVASTVKSEAPVVKPSVPIAPPPPPVKVESLGALAALGPISNSGPVTLSPNVQNLKIDKSSAPGLPAGPSVSGVTGALKATGGKLAAGGGGGTLRTGGSSVGASSAYGTQGLSSGTGQRGIAGQIVGSPKLASEGKFEGLTRQQVMTVVQKHAGDVQHCYEKSLLNNPGLAGRVEFEWDINAGGGVTDVRIKRSTVQKGDELTECVKGIFRGMQFPKATNGQSTTPTIGFPFGRM